MGSSQPLPIENGLAQQARLAGAKFERTAAAQIEHWAKLGQVLERTLSPASLHRVKQLAQVDDLGEVLERTENFADQLRAGTVARPE